MDLTNSSKHVSPVSATAVDKSGYLPVDILLLVYLAVTGLLIAVSSHFVSEHPTVTAFHFIGMVFAGCVYWLPRKASGIIRLTRLWYPYLYLPLLYCEMRYLNRLITTSFFDEQIVHAEQVLFRCQPSQVLSQLLPWSLVDELLHFCYGAYEILLPVIGLIFFLSRLDEQFHRFTTTVFLTFLTCYLLFILIPVRGPHHHFGPLVTASPGFFAELIHKLLGAASSEGTAFPSSHVAASISIWFGIRSVFRRLSRLILVVVIGIFIGTVYGGFHYGIDALAGLLVGLILGPLGLALHDWCLITRSESSPATSPADNCHT